MATTESSTREDPNALTSAPDAGAARRIRGGGPLATARRWWRQLTSMRTALLLLFLLAVAAAPGSLLPQHKLSESKVSAYYQQHPTLAPLMDKVGLFDVFSSAWFAAIYLLLLVSLVGCLTPRIRLHIRAMRRTPPDAPRHLSRMRVHDEFTLDEPAEDAARRVHRTLRSRRFRSVLRSHDDGTFTLSAEKGFLRETGNLLFHFSLVALLLGVALGSGYGWNGGRLLVQGDDNAFCDSLQQYDEYSLGPRVSGDDLPPFCVTLDSFHATYLPDAQPLTYFGDIRYSSDGGATTTPYKLAVNHPLRVDGASVYLVGHGYAPVIRYTDRYGRSQTTVSPFLETESTNDTSDGIAMFPDANVDPKTGKRDVNLQMAFQGVFFPTVAKQGGQGSTFPALRDPALLLFAYRGNTGTDAGIPHSVYTLDQTQIDNKQLKLVQKNPKLLRPGQSWTLPDKTKVQFVGVHQWASLQIRHDPGEKVVLVAAVLLLVGLLGSLALRRRRVWFRITDTPDGTTVAAAGLARTDYTGFRDEFNRLVVAAGGSPPPAVDPDADEPTPAPRPRTGGNAATEPTTEPDAEPANEPDAEPDAGSDADGDDESQAAGAATGTDDDGGPDVATDAAARGKD